MAKHTKIKLDINIHAPNIIIPEDIRKKDPVLLVANLGVLCIRTEVSKHIYPIHFTKGR